jgi:FAD/FMN-containing dehydrogenase/Fe-S oxidoreductase
MPDDVTTEDLVAALRERGVTEVDTSARRRAEYSTDASLYRVVPRVVVFPRASDELPAILDACRETGVPLVARGGGTSIAGNAVGTGVVVDTSRHLHRVRAIDPEAGTATVEPGVVLDDLQRAAAPYGLRFGPDPSSHSRCTIGGMLGNNACGSRALGYGRTADNVVELDTVTGAGERLLARRDADPGSSPTLTGLHRLVAADLALIRTELGRFGRQVSGYALEHLLPERRFDVAKALVGTEGGCALTLAATLRLVRVPPVTTLVVLGFPDMAQAADAVPALLPLRPVAIEGLDSRIVDVVRRVRGPGAVPPLPRGSGWLFVEISGADTAAVAGTVAAALTATDALDGLVVEDPRQAAALWRIREDGAGLAARPRHGHGAHAGWEDTAVPPEHLGAYLRDFERLLDRYGLVGLPYGHFGDGCVHVRIDFPLGEPDGTGVFRSFLLDAARLVASHGGSLSGEHGDGRARGELLPQMYSPAMLALFARVKAVFDPDDRLNPGVVVRPAPVDADLRIPAAAPVRHGLALRLRDDMGDFAKAVHRCTGVGKCRADNTGTGGVMCPSYLATRDEKDSTRGRSRVLQEMVNGSLVHGWRSAEVHEALDLCLACKGCAADCPTGVDMAGYKAEVLHQAYRRRLRPASHYSLGWLPRWAGLAGRVPRLANAALRSRAGALGQRLGGVDPQRSVPAFAPRTFRQWFRRHPVATGDPVLLWVDTFTNHFTPEVGIAAVSVLEDAGFSIRIPRRRLCCGLTWISTGQLDAARRTLRRSVTELAATVAQGVPVVGLEPSCTAVFRSDARELLDSAEAERVAGGMSTLAELLTRRAGWEAPDLRGVTAVAQPHCHHHAVLDWSTDQALLLQSGASVRRVGGCCGLAGNFGVEKGHYEVSVAIAETALLPAVRAAEPGTVVLADGFSCRVQLDQLAGRRGVHLAELLAGRETRREPGREPGRESGRKAGRE